MGEPYAALAEDASEALPPLEFTKLSLHYHFGDLDRNSKTADKLLDRSCSYIPQYSVGDAVRSIDDALNAGFRLLAHTNSNTMNLPYYFLSRSYARTRGIELLPGVEVNLQNWSDPKKFLHVVAIFSPDSDLLRIDQLINDFVSENQKNYLTIDQISEVLTSGQSILCVHGVKQNGERRSLSTNLEMVDGIAGLDCFLPVAIEENQPYHRKTLEMEIESALGLDSCSGWVDEAASISCADRHSFSEIASPTVMWAAPSFRDLYHATLMGGSRIMRTSDTVIKSNWISRIVIDRHKGMLPSEIVCSHGLNAIIGPSGSGKTLLLDIVKRKLTGEPLINKSIPKDANYLDMYDLEHIHLFDAEGREIGVSSNYTVVEGENLYQRILDMYQDDRGVLIGKLGISLEYKKYHELTSLFSQKLDVCVKTMQRISQVKKRCEEHLSQIISAEEFLGRNSILDVDSLEYVVDPSVKKLLEGADEILEGVAEDRAAAADAFKMLRGIAERYGFDERYAEDLERVQAGFSEQLAKYEVRITLQRLTLLRKKACQTMLAEACRNFNETMGEKSKQYLRRKQIVVDEFSALANDLLECVNLSSNCQPPVLSSAELSDSIGFSEEEAPAILDVSHVDCKILRSDLPDYFPGTIGRSKGAISVRNFTKEAYDLCAAGDVCELAATLAENDFDGQVVFSAKPDNLLSYEISLLIEGRYLPLESLSAGTLGKVYVEQFFDKAIAKGGSNAIIVYDQPDNNMEKSFIYSRLVEKFNSLRRQYQIFVATHEPLLVVNADANAILKANNDKTLGAQNASISYENRSFVSKMKLEDVTSDIARLIDGDESAVTKRSKVYRGLNCGM